MKNCFADIDFERITRCGYPEVIFSEKKTPAQVAAIAKSLVASRQPLLATRAHAEHARAVKKILPRAQYDEVARCIYLGKMPRKSSRVVGIVCAGTSDLPVAQEAAVTLSVFGWKYEVLCDVGVAGIHRLMSHVEKLRAFDVLIVAAGMEGALPSVVAGLVKRPVIALPTSVGYGANFGGISALLGMLTSCAAGVTVVNIDNGFGAARAADTILSLCEEKG